MTDTIRKSVYISKLLKKNIYAAQEKENIKVAFPMGLCMISEGVIPIAMNDIIRTVICTATGSRAICPKWKCCVKDS